MTIPAAAIAKAASAILSDEKTRRTAGWTVVAILSPVILLAAVFCSILGGSADHNNSILELCFYSGTLPSDLPEEYRAYIADMQASFLLLDECIAEINSMTEEGDSLDSIRVKAIFYDNAERWRTLLRQHQTKMAQAMKIPAYQFRWCAAFHDEGHHPHIHMMVWSADPKKGYLTRDGIHAMRSVLTNTIFQDEMHELYEKKDLAYRQLVTKARTAMAEYIERMEKVDTADPALAGKLAELAHALGSVTGKKQYGYLPKQVKAMVDSVVDELAKQPDVEKCYGVWNGLRDELERYYKDRPREHRPLSEQKEFRTIKNVIVREAERLRQELEQALQQTSEPEPQEEVEMEEATESDSFQESVETGDTSNVRRVPNQAVAGAVLNLLHHMGQVFRDNSPAPANPMGVRVDSKRRKKLQAKRLAMGHKMDDHENPEIQQTM